MRAHSRRKIVVTTGTAVAAITAAAAGGRFSLSRVSPVPASSSPSSCGAASAPPKVSPNVSSTSSPTPSHASPSRFSLSASPSASYASATDTSPHPPLPPLSFSLSKAKKVPPPAARGVGEKKASSSTSTPSSSTIPSTTPLFQLKRVGRKRRVAGEPKEATPPNDPPHPRGPHPEEKKKPTEAAAAEEECVTRSPIAWAWRHALLHCTRSGGVASIGSPVPLRVRLTRLLVGDGRGRRAVVSSSSAEGRAAPCARREGPTGWDGPRAKQVMRWESRLVPPLVALWVVHYCRVVLAPHADRRWQQWRAPAAGRTAVLPSEADAPTSMDVATALLTHLQHSVAMQQVGWRYMHQEGIFTTWGEESRSRALERRAARKKKENTASSPRRPRWGWLPHRSHTPVEAPPPVPSSLSKQTDAHEEGSKGDVALAFFAPAESSRQGWTTTVTSSTLRHTIQTTTRTTAAANPSASLPFFSLPSSSPTDRSDAANGLPRLHFGSSSSSSSLGGTSPLFPPNASFSFPPRSPPSHQTKMDTRAHRPSTIGPTLSSSSSSSSSSSFMGKKADTPSYSVGNNADGATAVSFSCEAPPSLPRVWYGGTAFRVGLLAHHILVLPVWIVVAALAPSFVHSTLWHSMQRLYLVYRTIPPFQTHASASSTSTSTTTSMVSASSPSSPPSPESRPCGMDPSSLSSSRFTLSPLSSSPPPLSSSSIRFTCPILPQEKQKRDRKPFPSTATGVEKKDGPQTHAAHPPIRFPSPFRAPTPTPTSLFPSPSSSSSTTMASSTLPSVSTPRGSTFGAWNDGRVPNVFVSNLFPSSSSAGPAITTTTTTTKTETVEEASFHEMPSSSSLSASFLLLQACHQRAQQCVDDQKIHHACCAIPANIWVALVVLNSILLFAAFGAGGFAMICSYPHNEMSR